MCYGPALIYLIALVMALHFASLLLIKLGGPWSGGSRSGAGVGLFILGGSLVNQADIPTTIGIEGHTLLHSYWSLLVGGGGGSVYVLLA